LANKICSVLFNSLITATQCRAAGVCTMYRYTRSCISPQILVNRTVWKT